MPNQQTIIQELRQQLPRLKKQYPIALIGLFGSYSRNEQTDDSDIDILYQTLPNCSLSLQNYLDLITDLQSITHKKIDLVNLKYINPVVWMEAQKDIIYV